MALNFKPFEDEELGQVTFIEGECPKCDCENSLIIMNSRQLRTTKYKMNIKCVRCLTRFEYIIEVYQ